MPVDFGLNPAQMLEWQDLQRGSGKVTTTVDVTDLAGNHLGSLSDLAVHGKLLVDRRARRSTRALALTMADPNGIVAFSTDTPSRTALGFNRMLEVAVETYLPSLGETVRCPIFTGPVTGHRRDGRTIRVEGHGKEILGLDELCDTLTVKATTPVTDAIATIMTKAGETRFALPDLPDRLPVTMSLGPHDRPFHAAQMLARSIGRELYYRPDGFLALRQLSTVPTYTFRADDTGEVNAGSVRTWDTLDGFFNAVEVTGAPPRGPKKQVWRRVEVPIGHDLAPGDLGRRIPHRVHNRYIATNTMAERIGRQDLDEALLAVTRVRFDATPVWHALEGDMVQLDSDDLLIPFRLDKFAHSIGTAGRHVMTVGVHTDTAPLEVVQ